MSPSLVRRVAIAASVGAIAACTAFEEDAPPRGGAGPGGAGGEGGGAGGTDAPTSFLPLLDAAHLCALAFECPHVAASIVLSTGVPIVEIDPDGQAGRMSYSACLEWLTAPVAAGHLGFDQARAILVCMAATTTCDEPGACAPIEALAPNDPRCIGQTGARCEGGARISCEQHVVAHCAGEAFAPGSECKEGADGVVACAIDDRCTQPSPTCDEYVFACGTGGLRVGFACGLYGLTCAEGIGCSAAMGPPPCATLGEQRCSGDGRYARVCAAEAPGGLLASEIGCESMGRSCEELGPTAVRCAAPSEACKPYDPDQNLCDPDGTRISVCVHGQPSVFDCASIGKGCIDGAGAVSAHCG